MEETIEVVSGSAVVEPTTSKDVPTAATEGARLGETQFSVVRHDRPLAERIEEAYGDELEPEEKELLDHAAEQFGRRLSDEE